MKRNLPLLLLFSYFLECSGIFTLIYLPFYSWQNSQEQSLSTPVSQDSYVRLQERQPPLPPGPRATTVQWSFRTNMLPELHSESGIPEEQCWSRNMFWLPQIFVIVIYFFFLLWGKISLSLGNCPLATPCYLLELSPTVFPHILLTKLSLSQVQSFSLPGV